MNCKEKVKFFSPIMGWIILPLFFTNKCCGSCPVMTICNVSVRHLFYKQLFYQFDCFRFINNPEMVAKTVLCNKIIFGFFGVDNLIYYFINLFNCRICKKNRFNISIVDTDMYHTVLFFIKTRKFML